MAAKIPPFVIITGLSGSGKGTGSKPLQYGYFCVDTSLSDLKFAEVCNRAGSSDRSCCLSSMSANGSAREVPKVL